MAKRLDWIDQARGLSIFLVVYGHNFPTYEPYIYSFHVPLFFLISGMFHPREVTLPVVIKRAKMILVPYFFWAFALFLFWVFIGRKFGESSEASLSVWDNFLGIFYAQGGQQYMDWGIPLWFLPCIFLVFILFSLIKRIERPFLMHVVMFCVFLFGILWPVFFEVHLPWSLDVAMVAMGFYFFGNILKAPLIKISTKSTFILMLVLFAIHIITFYYNTSKVDMYRSLYGEELFFFISGLTGSLAYILFFKLAPIFKFLAFLGRHTIVLLATHIRMLTAIKLIMMLVFGMTVFEFTETEKFLLSILQVIMVLPVIWLINKYVPSLDGKISNS